MPSAASSLARSSACPGKYERTPNRHDFSLEPRRPNYLSAIRAAGQTTYGVGKISDIFAGCDIDESFPTKSNVDGINRTIELLENIDEGFVFTNLVETDQLWGHRNDPVNFHRCLQDFDRRLPDILEALRDGDLLIITSDHGCDPTTPSSDHSREYAMLLAYAAGRNAAGRIHEDGEFGDVGATVCAWLGAKHPGKGAPGLADHRRRETRRPRGRTGAVRTRGWARGTSFGLRNRRSVTTRERSHFARSPRVSRGRCSRSGLARVS